MQKFNICGFDIHFMVYQNIMLFNKRDLEGALDPKILDSIIANSPDEIFPLCDFNSIDKMIETLNLESFKDKSVVSTLNVKKAIIRGESTEFKATLLKYIYSLNSRKKT